MNLTSIQKLLLLGHGLFKSLPSQSDLELPKCGCSRSWGPQSPCGPVQNLCWRISNVVVTIAILSFLFFLLSVWDEAPVPFSAVRAGGSIRQNASWVLGNECTKE